MTIDDFLATTRRPNMPTLPELVYEYEKLYASIIAVSPPLIREVTPTLRIVNTLNKQTQLIPIRGQYYLVHDQYLGQTLNLLTKYFALSAPIAYARAMGLRLVSEAATCCGRLDLATYFAVAYSVAQYKAKNQDIPEAGEQWQKRSNATSVQEAFVIAHEMAHLVWRTARFDPTVIDWLLEFLVHEDQGDVDQSVEDYLNDLSFLYSEGEIVQENIKTKQDREVINAKVRAKLRQRFIEDGPKQVRANARLRQNALFREEVYADYAAAQTCVELFQDKMDWTDLMIAIHLALENITTMSMITQHAYRIFSIEFQLNPLAVAARKRALRRALEHWTQERSPEQPHLGHSILTKANRRYMRFIRDPITIDLAGRLSVESLPKLDDLRDTREAMLRAYPESVDPQYIIRHILFK